jgi:hypothetical protein
MVSDLWSLHGDGRPVVGRLVREAIIGRLLEDGLEPELADAARTPGFAALLSRLVQSPLLESCRRPTGLKGVDSGILDFLQRYQSDLAHACLVERACASERIAALAPRLDGPLGVIRFDTLSTGEVRLIKGLSARNEVSVALTWASACAPTVANDPLVALMAPLASEHLVLPEPAPVGEIAMLAGSLYGPPKSILSAGEVSTGLASGIEAEATLVSRAARTEIDSGVAPERIAVVFPGFDGRLDVLKAALRSAGVPAEFDVRIGFGATGFGRAYRGLLSLACGVGGRSEAMEYISSIYSGVEPERAQALDRQWRSRRTTSPAALLSSLIDLGGPCARAPLAARRAAASVLRPDMQSDWQEMADSLLGWGAAGGRGGQSAIEDGRAYQAVMRSIAEMSRAAPSEFSAMDVLRALGQLSATGDSSESTGYVQVCEASAIGARRFDVVIIGGLTEAEYSAARRDSLEGELLAAMGEPVALNTGDLARLRFYALVSRARKRLVLVRQEADSDGRELRASALWEDALDVYRPVGAHIDDQALSPAPQERLVRSDLVDLAPALTSERLTRRAAASEMVFRNPERQSVDSGPGREALGSSRSFSATEVEAYLACPYRWFYQRVVRPTEIDRELDARELGSLAHRALAAFYGRMSQMGSMPRVTPDNSEAALALFDEVAQAERGRLSWSSGLAEEMAIGRALGGARAVVGQDALFLPSYMPSHMELSFGRDGSFEFAGGAFAGRIDRVDSGSDAVFVTDYKSSKAVSGWAKFEPEGKVQAVVYALAAEHELGLPVSGSVYRSMSGGVLRGFWRHDLLGEMPQGMCADDALDAEGYLQLVERTSERTSEAIEGMRAGRVEREPRVKGACLYCAVAGLCERAAS